jgi:hypothetical protein
LDRNRLGHRLDEQPYRRRGRGDYNIAPEHLTDAIERLVERSQRSLSDDRTPADPYSRPKRR